MVASSDSLCFPQVIFYKVTHMSIVMLFQLEYMENIEHLYCIHIMRMDGDVTQVCDSAMCGKLMGQWCLICQW